MLTPEERRGAVLVLALVLIGAAWDATRALYPRLAPVTPGGRPAAAFSGPVADDSILSVAGRAAASPAGALPAAEAPPAALPLNRATAAQLETLPGIGPVLAGRIVAHREKFGPFRSTEELRAVRGVGPRLLERLRGRLRTGP